MGKPGALATHLLFQERELPFATHHRPSLRHGATLRTLCIATVDFTN
jgi:hypothetical protein